MSSETDNTSSTAPEVDRGTTASSGTASSGAGSPDDLVGAIWQGNRQPGNRDQAEQAQFYWVDPESGERLELRVEGDEGFLSGLENLGFVRQSTHGSNNTRRHAGETPRRNSTTGGPHPGWQGRRGA